MATTNTAKAKQPNKTAPKRSPKTGENRNTPKDVRKPQARRARQDQSVASGAGGDGTERRRTKKQTCIDLLSRPDGATLDDLQRVTGWQAHSIRGFLSGTVKKLPGVVLAADRPDGGSRRYRIVEKPKAA